MSKIKYKLVAIHEKTDEVLATIMGGGEHIIEQIGRLERKEALTSRCLHCYEVCEEAFCSSECAADHEYDLQENIVTNN